MCHRCSNEQEHLDIRRFTYVPSPGGSGEGSSREVPKEQEGINPKDLIGTKKPDLTLLPYDALIGIAKCMQDGAVKYGPFNWREKGKKVTTRTYVAAAIRHLFSYLARQDNCSDSGNNHVDAAIAGLMVLRDAQANNNCVDDRLAAGVFPDQVDEMLNNCKECVDDYNRSEEK